MPAAARATLLDHQLRSHDDATDLVRAARARAAPMSARNRELFGLIPAALLVTARLRGRLHPAADTLLANVSLTYGGDLPRPVPRARTSSCASRCPTPTRTCSRSSRCWRASGSSMHLPHRRHARARAGAVVRGRAGRVRGDDRVPARLPRARALPLHDRARSGSCCCAAAPAGHRRAGQRRLPGHRIGPVTFQPAELAKIAIVIFLASYLRDTRQVLVQGARRIMGSRSRRSSTSGRCWSSGAWRCCCSSSSATSARR